MQHHDDEAEFDQIIQRLYELREMAAKKIKSSISLTTAKEGFLNACQARKLSLNTIEDYTRSIDKFISYIGDMPMNSVTSKQITAFLASLVDVKAKTVLNRHIGLAAFWTWALKDGYVDRHVVRAVEKPRPQQILIEPFTEAEIRALLTAVRHHPDRDRSIVYLLLDCGIRASELVGAKREDIDLANSRISVKGGKGNKDRMVPFSKKTASVLFRYLSNSTGKPFPITRTSLTSLLDRMGKRVGVKNCHPHRFRHTFAINYLRNGGDAYTLQEMLGHSTMEMVRRYLNIAQVDLERAHNRASPVTNWGL